MKALKDASTSTGPTSAVALARFRLARAESQLESAKAQARLAKRRRKEAKQAARAARKQARLAKREVAEAKLALVEAEDKLSLPARSATKAKPRKKPVTKAATIAIGKEPALAHASHAPKPATRKRPKPVPAKTVADLRPAPAGDRQTSMAPRDLAPSEQAAASTSNEAVPDKQANANPAENL
jgi:hypothetical protein